ncbi:MAG: hypothetical protein CSB49_01005 [Proteobacteria bacterium]|nr:MAG: hypothetical protein CSB49_01005 [Pseudomonadota bacterium]
MKHVMRMILLVGCGFWLAGAAPARTQSQPQVPSPSSRDLGDLLAYAEAHHPTLIAARAQAAALRQDAVVAGSLPDLKLAWGEMLVPVETRVGAQQRVFSLSQSIPWFGTLGSASEAAGLRAQAADERGRAAGLKVRREIYRAWFEVARLRAEQKLVARKGDLLEQELATAHAVYESNSMTYTGLVRLRMSRQRLRNRLLTIEDALGPAMASLAVAAGMPANWATDRTTDLAMPPQATLPSRPDDLPDPAAMIQHVRAANPALAGLRLQEQGYAQDEHTARLRGKPGLTLGLDYIMTDQATMPGVTDSGKDPVIARVAVSLPLWSGKASARRQASAGRREMAAADRRHLELELEDELQRVLFRLHAAERRLALLTDDLLPAARQLRTAARADYETGRGALAQLLSIRGEILDLEIEKLRHEADRALALVDLDILQGGGGDAFLFFPGE